MANIANLLQAIKTAIYGRDVRDSIHDSIEAINDQVEYAVEHQLITLDDTLTMRGSGADAKAVGDRLTAIENGSGGGGGSTNPYTLPVAKEDTLGGVMPRNKTSQDTYTLTQPVYVDGSGRLWTKPLAGIRVYYGFCTAAGSSQNKAVTCSDSNFASEDFSDGAFILNVYFQYTQSYDASSSAMTLNVNGTGAKSVYRYGTTKASVNAWKAGEVVSFIYKGGAYTMLTGSALRDGEGGGSGSYTLPMATGTTLGGVKADAASSSMTQAVGIDSNGKLWTTPSSGGSSSGTGNKFYFGTVMTVVDSTERVYAQSNITNAVVDDIYINTDYWRVYRCTYGGAAINAKWVYQGTIKGADGSTPSLSVGTVTKLSYNDNPTVTFTAVSGGYQINFGIPQGEPGPSGSGSGGNTPFVLCSTAAGTSTKAVSYTDFSFSLGASLLVEFQNANTASNPTLSVNSGVAKSIRLNRNTPAGSGAWEAGEVKLLVYDGDYWIIVGGNIPNGNGVSY